VVCRLLRQAIIQRRPVISSSLYGLLVGPIAYIICIVAVIQVVGFSCKHFIGNNFTPQMSFFLLGSDPMATVWKGFLPFIIIAHNFWIVSRKTHAFLLVQFLQVLLRKKPLFCHLTMVTLETASGPPQSPQSPPSPHIPKQGTSSPIFNDNFHPELSFQQKHWAQYIHVRDALQPACRHQQGNRRHHHGQCNTQLPFFSRKCTTSLPFMPSDRIFATPLISRSYYIGN